MKGLAIFGSTGSIGRQTLDIVRAFPHDLRVVGLAAGSNKELLLHQIQEFKPQLVYSQIPLPPDTACQDATLEEIATHPQVDMVVMAIPGKTALFPSLTAIKAGKPLALASKEVLVMAGELIMKEAQLHRISILPVDSEHSAIWQCLLGEESPNHVARLILTASGGAFRDYPPSRLSRVTPQEALQHPTWHMGRKVTIDSATLMNKGLEIIEAHWLFSMPYTQIDVVLHRESIIHSLVEFADGSLKAQLSHPDMRFPIQYALFYPRRQYNGGLPKLDLTKIGALTFGEIERSRFPCLSLAQEAGKQGGTYPAVLNAADEIAVDFFLQGKIPFLTIPVLIERALEHHLGIKEPTLEEILAADNWARDFLIRGLP